MRCWAQEPEKRPALVEVIQTLKEGLNQLKGKTAPQQKPLVNEYTPSLSPIVGSGHYIAGQSYGVVPPSQLPISGNYVGRGIYLNPEQNRVPQPLSGNYVAPRNLGLFRNQGRGSSPAPSGGYVQQPIIPSSNNNNNNNLAGPGMQ